MKEYISRQAAISILSAKSDMAIGTPKQCFAAAAKMMERLPVVNAVQTKYRLGTLVYYECGGDIYEEEVVSIRILEGGIVYETATVAFTENDVGKGIYLTWAQAEAGKEIAWQMR